MITHRKNLKSVWIAGGEVRRSLVTVGREPVVLFRKSHPILRPRFDRAAWRDFALSHDLTTEAKQEVLKWNRQLRFSFNCHTLSLGPLLGLGPNTWLEGSSSVFTLMENPADTLLGAFFQQLDSVDCLGELPRGLQDDDVVMFCDGHSGDLVHSGRIRIQGGKTMLLSKLGEHPAATVLLDAVANEYRGQFDCIRLYRYEVRAESPSFNLGVTAGTTWRSFPVSSFD